MKNTTVKELIDILKEMDQDAIVCSLELDMDDDDEPIFSTFVICRGYTNVKYVDDGGKDVVGDVITLY
jgi:hypothetical protein